MAAGTGAHVERETGSRYLYLGGELRPVLNYTSARLILGEALTVREVSRRSLAGVRHGQPIGIVGAPDALPTVPVRELSWTLCVEWSADLSGGGGRLGNVLAVTAGRTGVPLSADRAILARSAGGDDYLVWSGRRYRLTRPWLAKVLGYDGLGVPVTADWLDVVPAGPDIGAIDVPGRGRPGRPSTAGTRLGQVFVARNAGTTERYYLLRSEGLSPLTETGAALVLGDPATATAYPGQRPAALPLSPAALAVAPSTTAPAILASLPPRPPTVDAPTGAGMPCVRLTPAAVAPAPSVEILTGVPDPRAQPVRPAPETTGMRADVRVRVDAGAGGPVTVARSGQAGGSSLALLTDAGVTYPMSGDTTAKSLGFADTTAVAVPAVLLRLLPTGPVLDPARVRG